MKFIQQVLINSMVIAFYIYSEPYQVRSCDFESSAFCGWIQDTTDDFDWTRHSGETTTGRTGPNSDHTLGPHDPTGTALNIFYIDEKTVEYFLIIKISDQQNVRTQPCRLHVYYFH